MKKIRVLFLSIQPSVLTAIISFITSDPLVIPNFDEYNNYDKRRKKYDVVVFDDTSKNNNGLEIIRNALTTNGRYKKILYTESTDMNYLSLIESSSFI